MTDVAAIVLAAGRSRRMGKFKPLLPFGANTVIQTVVDNLRRAGIEQIIVVAGHRADEVQHQLQVSSVQFVMNPDPDSEMSVSIALGIDAVSGDARAVLIVPVDCPAIPPEIPRGLIDRWTEGARLIQPEYAGKGGHPVLIDLKYRDELRAQNAEKGLRGFFDNHRADVLRLAVDSPFIARDMDTWDDYVRLHQEVFGRKPRETAPFDEINA